MNSSKAQFSQICLALCILLSVHTFASPVLAQEDSDLAQQLANPLAALISLPIQANYDTHWGLDEEGSVWRVNIQPVMPFSMTENWNLISRTIVPLIEQGDLPTRGFGESGLGDIVQSIFFSPKAPTSGGWIWGVGPVFLLPTASDDALGADQWGVGPTAVALKQIGPWTVGGLFNHIESIAGNDDRPDVSATFLQPFLAYITSTKTTFTLNTEATYDWEGEEWSLPINVFVSQMLKLGKMPVQVGAGVRYWAVSPLGGPQDWALRLQLTFLFPK